MARRGEQGGLNLKWIFLIILCGLLLVGYYLYTQIADIQDTQANLAYIAQHYNGAGKLVDYTNDIGVKTIDDIHLYVREGKQVKIDYGKLTLEWSYKDFLTESNFKALKSIHLSYKCKPDGTDLKVYFEEQELVRWVW